MDKRMEMGRLNAAVTIRMRLIAGWMTALGLAMGISTLALSAWR